MKFWIIHAQENPAEPRTNTARREWRSNTLSETLADRGHDVTRWRSSFSHQAKKQLVQGSVREPVENYHHQYIESPSYKRHVGLGRILNHRALGRNFTRVAEGYDERPDLIHVCNVPIELAHAAVVFGQRHEIPVILDVRDLWPDVYIDFIEGKAPILRGPAAFWFNNFSFRLTHAFRNATAVTALTGSYLDWAAEKAGRTRRDTDRIFAMAYPRLDGTAPEGSLDALKGRLGLADGDVLATYLGNIGYQSDFATTIEAARLLAERHPNFKLVIAGSGPQEPALKEQAAGLANVIFPGWLNGDEVRALMRLSSFGLVAYRAVPNYLLNVPNKFPEYLAGGLAIACALEGEMGALVRETGCGFVYEQGNPQNLADAFADALAEPARIEAMGQAAAALHRSHFDGAEIYPAFADYLETMAAQPVQP